jgi:hypothetical protein
MGFARFAAPFLLFVFFFFFGIHSKLDLDIFRLDYFPLTQSTGKNINNKPIINSNHYNFFNSKTSLHGQIKYLHIFLLQILHPIMLHCLGDKGFPKIKSKYKCKTYSLKLMSKSCEAPNSKTKLADC